MQGFGGVSWTEANAIGRAKSGGFLRRLFGTPGSPASDSGMLRLSFWCRRMSPKKSGASSPSQMN
jgi:hypothetical protein